jgi:Na+-driven multidrug efflux pump
MLLFNPDQDFLALGTLALSIFALNFFAGLDAPLSSFFQGIGKAIPSLVVASSRQLIFLIPCLLIMPSIYGLTGLWAAYPVAGTMSIMLSLAWTGITFNKLKIPFRMYSKISQL